MNTFHTMFGRPIPDREGYFSGLEKYSPPGELREKVRHFSRLCSSVGNYVVLPNYYAEGTTLNCYRGTNEWHDFFDRFLRELRKVLTASQEQDALLQTLVRINDFCFGPFRSGEGFRTLIRELFLEEYCFEDGRVREVFPMNFHWMDTGAREQYLSDAGTYLEKSCSIIKNRSRRICEKLKTKLLSV